LALPEPEMSRLRRRHHQPAQLNPIRRHLSYPRVVRRARLHSYRVKRPGDTGTRYNGPPTIRLVNLPATVMISLG
jgi:hypothetical protein